MDKKADFYIIECWDYHYMYIGGIFKTEKEALEVANAYNKEDLSELVVWSCDYGQDGYVDKILEIKGGYYGY